MKKTAGAIVLATTFIMLAVGALSAVAGPVTQLTACLKIVPGEPLGEAIYSSWDNDMSRLEIAVAGVEPGSYRIVIDCERLDTMLTVDETGAGSLRLDTRWGDTIPLIESGSTICLKLDQVVVLSGKFK